MPPPRRRFRPAWFARAVCRLAVWQSWAPLSPLVERLILNEGSVIVRGVFLNAAPLESSTNSREHHDDQQGDCIGGRQKRFENRRGIQPCRIIENVEHRRHVELLKLLLGHFGDRGIKVKDL